MKNRTKTFWLILFLAALASILVIWKLFFFSTPSDQIIPTPTPTPTTSPTPALLPTLPPNEGLGDSPEEFGRAILKDFPLYRWLPYQTAQFKIDYVAPMKLKIILKTEKTAAIEEEVLNWIGSKGIAPSTHQIEWITPEF